MAPRNKIRTHFSPDKPAENNPLTSECWNRCARMPTFAGCGHTATSHTQWADVLTRGRTGFVAGLSIPCSPRNALHRQGARWEVGGRRGRIQGCRTLVPSPRVEPVRLQARYSRPATRHRAVGARDGVTQCLERARWGRRKGRPRCFPCPILRMPRGNRYSVLLPG